MTKRRKSGESGYALLLVFLMSALIAVGLYRQLPRVAFESQRAKEQLLIERGEQYKRAIQLFVRKNQRYPAKIEDLENTNNIRYLRRRYKDPMTGKDEWRLIRAGPGGVLIDSVKTKKKEAGKEENRNTFIGEGPVIGAAQTAPAQPAAALRRRASEMPGEGAPGMMAGQPGEQVPGQPGLILQPGMVPGQPGIPGQPGMQPGMPGQPGMIPGQPGMAYQPSMPPQGMPGVVPGMGVLQPGAVPGQMPPGMIPGQPMPGMPGVPGMPGQPQPQPQTGGFVGGGAYVGGGAAPSGFGQAPPVNSQAGGVSPYQNMPGQQGNMPGFPGGTYRAGPGQPGPGQNEAVKMIQQILTSPRPMGNPAAGGQGMGGQVVGGGIAGVASTLEQDSIMIYEETQKYNEWEFIYDMSKDRTGAGMGRGVQVGTPGDRQGGQGTQGGFGQGGFGQGGGFGQSPTPRPGGRRN